MTAQIMEKFAAAAVCRHSKGSQGEYSLNNDSPSGQEWILEAYSALEPRNYLREFTSRNVRPDGRTFSASRPVTVLPSIFARNAHGSAMVTLGVGDGGARDDDGGRPRRCTRVVAACTLLVGRPSPSTPDEGDVDVTLTASPLSGPRFDIAGRESGDVFPGDYGAANDGGGDRAQLPGNLSIVVSRTHDDHSDDANPSPTDVKEIESWIRRTLRSSRFVNPTELGIEHGVAAWRVRLSIHVLNHEGNVWDAALLCACAALTDLRLPMVEIDGGVVKIVKNEGGGGMDGRNEKVRTRRGRSLTPGPLPVPLTIVVLPPNDEGEGKRKSVLLADPTHLEEDVAAGNTVTAVCNVNEEIVEFHKKGSRSRLSTEQMAAVACMGFGRAKELERVVLGIR